MVSVIVPVWNKSDLTHQFLFRNWQLYKNRIDVEFIVVDNGSTDNTDKILFRWREVMGNRLTVIVLAECSANIPGRQINIATSQSNCGSGADDAICPGGRSVVQNGRI